MHLSGVDANLFVVLRAILETGNLTRAGKKLGLSPSATSHALGRLRAMLGDPLLVRSGRALVPTARALALRDPLITALDTLEGTLATSGALDPRGLRRAFRVETTDHVQLVLLRALDAGARKEAPQVDVYMQSLREGTVERLRAGEIDVAISVFGELPPDVEHETLFEDRLVAVVRKGHPALRERMTLARFASYEHLLVAPNGSPTGLVDRVLADHGLKRRVARTSSTFLDIAFLVAESDYVVSLPRTVVTPVLERLGLVMLPMPLPLPSFTHRIAWHRRTTHDAAQAWFRGLVKRAIGEVRGEARRGRRARSARTSSAAGAVSPAGAARTSTRERTRPGARGAATPKRR